MYNNRLVACQFVAIQIHLCRSVCLCHFAYVCACRLSVSAYVCLFACLFCLCLSLPACLFLLIFLLLSACLFLHMPVSVCLSVSVSLCAITFILHKLTDKARESSRNGPRETFRKEAVVSLDTKSHHGHHWRERGGERHRKTTNKQTNKQKQQQQNNSISYKPYRDHFPTTFCLDTALHLARNKSLSERSSRREG